jgi:FtsZ-binding cell division protein ZapB
VTESKEGGWGLRALVAGLLLAALLLAPTAVAAPPYPVDAEVEARDPLPGGPFYYAVRVTASRSVDVVVRACVRVPGWGWGGWVTLWSGRLRAGETRVLQGSDDRAVAAAGDYVVIVQVDFYSDQDYAVLGGSTYYATYYAVYVHPYAKALYRALGEMYEELEADYARLKRDFDLLRAGHRLLQADYGRLKAELDRVRGDLEAARAERDRLAAENERLRSENQQLSERVAQLRRALELADRALGLLALSLTALVAALVAAAAVRLVRMYRRGQQLLVKQGQKG